MVDIDNIIKNELESKEDAFTEVDILAEENKVRQLILERFPVLETHLHIQRKARMFLDPLSHRDFEKVFRFLTMEGGFDSFHLIVGVDDGEYLGFHYILSNTDHILLTVKQRVPKARPIIKSICDRFPNALWHERELVDLFGAIIENLPPGPSYPLPDGWPAGNYPLRKEWKPEYFDCETMTYHEPQVPEAPGADE